MPPTAPPHVDHARRAIAVTPGQLALLAATAAGVDDRLDGRPEAATVRAQLMAAGALGAQAPPWVGRLARVVARPRARIAADARSPAGATIAHRAWVGDEHGVVGREASEERIELVVVPRGLVVLALARTLGMRPRPEPADAPAFVVDGEPGDVRAAWRFAGMEAEDALSVLDLGERGLWVAEPAGERLRLSPTTLRAVLERVAVLLGAQAASSR